MKKSPLFILFLGIILILAACMPDPAPSSSEGLPSSNDVSGMDSSADTVSDIPSSKSDPQFFTISVGEMFSIGDWDITLNTLSGLESIEVGGQSYQAGEGNEFIIADLTVQNNGETAQTFLSIMKEETLQAKIVYAAENEYEPTALLSNSGDIMNKKIEPQTSRSGALIFSVTDEAAASSELQLLFTKGSDTYTCNIDFSPRNS